MSKQPGLDHVIEQQTVKILTAVHGNAAMGTETDATEDVFHNGNVQHIFAQVIHQKDSIPFVLVQLVHHAYHRRHRLLHQSHFANSGHFRCRFGCILLHLIESSRYRDDRAHLWIVAYLLWQIAEQHPQHFC